MKDKNIPVKNYVVVLVIAIITIAVTFLLMNKYNKEREYNEATNDNLKILSEIKENEIENYLMENHNVIIYMSSSNNINIEKFEKDFNKYIIKHNLTKDIIYLNMVNVSDSFYDKFYLNYFKENSHINVDLKKEPNLFIFENGEIVDYLLSSKEEITLDKVKEFFKVNGVLE